MNNKSERKKGADYLFRAIMNKRKAEWWKEEIYVKRYPLEESGCALGNVFAVFDEYWLKHTLNSWVERGGRGHPIIRFLVPEVLGLWSFW